MNASVEAAAASAPAALGTAARPTRILFVCLGNICRSPMAQGAFEAAAAQAGVANRFEVDSAGIGDWHAGQTPDPRAMAEMAAAGHDISSQRARKIRPADFAEYDLIVGMDAGNMADLAALTPAGARARVTRLMDFAPGQAGRDVPDPFFGGPEGFGPVRAMVEAAAAGLIAAYAAPIAPSAAPPAASSGNTSSTT